MPFERNLADLLEMATKTDFDLMAVQKQANNLLKREFNCEETAFLLLEKGRRRFICQVCGSRDFLPNALDAGPSSSWQCSFGEKNSLEFKELSVELATNVSTIFNPIDVTIRAITLHALHSPVSNLYPKSTSIVSNSSNTSAANNLIAVCCIAHSENRSILCCKSKDITRQVSGNSLDNFLRTIASIVSVSKSLSRQKSLTKQCECLLTTAQTVFSNLEDMSQLASNIIREAKRLIQCEFCILFIVDRENLELVAFALDPANGADSSQNDVEGMSETRLPQNRGIVGAVANSGSFVCLTNPMDNPNFDSSVDNLINKKLRNVMCIPIKDKHGTIAIAELCNKIDAAEFLEKDEQAAMSFSVYCSTSISHCLLYRRLREAHRRSNVASELMLYHTQKIAEEDVLRLSLCLIPLPSAISEDFYKFSFIPRSVPNHETITACLTMFEDLGFLSKFRIKRKVLSRFLLLVEKGYRDVPYHNWGHAFAVAHFCYLMLKLLPIGNYLSDLEQLSLFVACLCHDIDHRGTTNSFQVQSKSMLAQLYSSEGSVLERHHFAQTMCILNIENCNIFDALSAKDYQTVLDNMRDVILATDIAQHLRLRKGMEQLAYNGFTYENKHNHYLLSCLMITACDLSDQTKKWTVSKHIAGQIYAEFFSQGDLERAMGNKPNLMMDRERACVPKLQIDFLDTIALPCYKLLAKVFADTRSVYSTIYHNRRCYVMMHKMLVQANSGDHNKCTLDALRDNDLEDEVLRTVGPVEILSPDELLLAADREALAPLVNADKLGNDAALNT